MTAEPMLAGAAAAEIAPPLGLPMLGFVRSQEGATRFGLPLEATALVLATDSERVVLCGIDTLGADSPEVDELRERVAEAADAAPANVLLNWNHTHKAPPPCRSLLRGSGLLATDGDERIDAYWALLRERVMHVAATAAARLEPAAAHWGSGEVDLSVNRRERGPDGSIVHGWRVDGLLDRQVVSLQVRRRDESAIATLVGYGCHTVSVGMDFPGYSADFPGALRRRMRQWTGGECVFFQGAAGNVLPRLAFTEDEREAERMGERLAIESIRSLSDGAAWPRQLVQHSDGSLIPMLLFRYEELPERGETLRAAEERLAFPLLPLPSEDDLQSAVGEYEDEAREAERRGAGAAERCGILYHLKWARRMLADTRAGAVADSIPGSLHAVRIGAGVIVSSPGEAFTEIGMAVKERAPGRPTLYAGYTNGAVGYFPTSAAYAEGGYEPAYSNRSYGRPAPVAPECERLLVERGVRLAERLFPELEPFAGGDWSARGALPELAHEPPRRPLSGEYAPPRTARHPQPTHGGQQ
jgi:neutral ceramidase